MSSYILFFLEGFPYPFLVLGEGRGVFPLLGMLSHSCISNCKYINVDDGRRMECRATVPIKKGEQILGHYVSPMLNTQKRLSNLRLEIKLI